ncbi:MAG: formylglycine-generating enzyme family protein [Candidatus Riflebacteria bacterium]|nr:formylglycine-generating enzyme family protein [Candidatus Riflebacteria bacterium]
MRFAIIILVILVTFIPGLQSAAQTPVATHTIELPGGVKMEFCLIPASSFTMGPRTRSHEGGPADKKPDVILTRDFHMGKYEVTQAQWTAVMGSWDREEREREYIKVWMMYEYRMPYDTIEIPINRPDWTGVGDNNPVYWVSWYDAAQFCNALSVMQGLTPCYEIVEKDGFFEVTWKTEKCDGYRLPTEAEWEYAASCGIKESKYYWGDEIDEAYVQITPQIDPPRSFPVGQKKPNAFGLYDMIGNVSEWCWDIKDIGYVAMDPRGLDDDDKPISPEGCPCVIRGGAEQGMRETYRCGYYSDRHSSIGFRIVRIARTVDRPRDFFVRESKKKLRELAEERRRQWLSE